METNLAAEDINPAELLPGISDYIFRYASEHPDRVAMRDD